MAPFPIQVALVFGGTSSEHDVSCLTAGSVARSIDPEQFTIVGIGITPSGRWTIVPGETVRRMEVRDQELPRLSENWPDCVLFSEQGRTRVATRDGDRLVDAVDIDVAFALLHGPFGEDGTIQGLFEMHGIPYVGSGVAASAIGMDKDLMKRALGSAGIPGCRWVSFTSGQWLADPASCLESVGTLRFPVFVKPARGGSSVGIVRVAEAAALPAAIEEARRHDPKIVVEEGFVGAREIELAVLGGRDGGPPRVSLPGEIRMHTADAFYDFDAKYLPESQVTLDIPAVVDRGLRDTVTHLAIDTFQALGAEGLARVDLFVTPDGRAFVNEINTMPGFTRLSMFPLLWKASGLGYRALITDLITQALERPQGLR